MMISGHNHLIWFKNSNTTPDSSLSTSSDSYIGPIVIGGVLKMWFAHPLVDSLMQSVGIVIGKAT